ncbi:Hypothetical predicted protein [Olea europaea subsp. europaea]|uniref:Uncharacterized protein n=1 Tax=Olea europaea subsp. europaea TaxID=158383 RepID=A0A8S0VMA5_OLEEU|nr:Hypothetical predicted protein [Olea europaea subsp. europaea]
MVEQEFKNDGKNRYSTDMTGPRSLEDILKKKRDETLGSKNGKTWSDEKNNQKNGNSNETSIRLYNSKEDKSASSNKAGTEEITSTDASELEAQDDGEYCEGDNEDAEDEYHTEEEDQDDEFVTKMSVMS